MDTHGVGKESAAETSQWWALYTKHQHEKAIADALTRKSFEVFLPMYDSVRIWKDRKKTISIPLFQCYVFLRGGLDRRLQVVSTPGVFSVLSRGGNVATIPDIEITAIQRTLEEGMRVEPHPFLNCGDRVRVIRGSLEGIKGILVRKKGLCRLVLSVDMLAQSISVEIPASDVEPESPMIANLRTSRQLPIQPATSLPHDGALQSFVSSAPMHP